MSRPVLPSGMTSQVLVGASVILLLLAAVAPVAAQPTRTLGSTKSAPTVDTYSGWPGDTYIGWFGKDDVATFGQTFTVPGDETNLVRFKFFMQPQEAGQLILRGEVYRWDGTRAIGHAAWESQPRPFDFTDAHMYKVACHVHGISLAGGAQYVLFVSISKEYEETTSGYYTIWPDSGNSYSGGDFDFLNDGGDESRWTSDPWGILPSDTGFRVWLRP